MCAIAGIIQIDNATPASLKQKLKAMGQVLQHRGPDQQNTWLSADNRVGFAHRRLSILDLSEAGKQPMQSNCGRFVLSYNGEVYNYKEIASQLTDAGINVNSDSDTAVILAAIAHWGLEAAVQQFHGMFAFSLYDAEQQCVYFVRDRLGEKPLYIGSYNGQILFASELKACHTQFEKTPPIDKEALALYLRHGYVPTPYSIFQDFYKLPAASLLKINLANVSEFIKQPELLHQRATRYWQLDPQADRVAGTESDVDQAQQQFEQTLLQTVGRQMRSDVPFGAFLSGGVDSSAIVAAMGQQTQTSVSTFSIGFEQKEFNEAPFAKAVAEHLQTNHHQKIVTAQDALGLIADLPQIYDEPFADSSQLPTLLVSQMAREHVTVCLSGDGGDELFGGYERYQWAQAIWSKIAWMPKPTRIVLAQLLSLLSSGLAPKQHQYKFERLASLISSRDRQIFYRALLSSQLNPWDFIVGSDLGQKSPSNYSLTEPVLSNDEFIHQMMYLDMHSYLPDDILTKVDRASMHYSLEVRVPLLDHSLVEQAWALRQQALKPVKSKQVLRHFLYQHVPSQLIERPKKGFAVPLREWLMGELKEWAEQLLAPERLQDEGVFDAQQIDKVWCEFKSGKTGSEHFIWSVLMFQQWQQQWCK